MCDILTYKETTGGVKVLKHYLKVCFKMMGTHVITAIFSFMLCPLIFLALLSSKFGWILMSIATSIGYAIMVYSCAYKIADKDIKVDSIVRILEIKKSVAYGEVDLEVCK